MTRYTTRDLAREKDWYPPRSKTDVMQLRNFATTYTTDNRNKLSVLTDIGYRAITPNGSGLIRGYSHDRTTGELILTVRTDSERITVPLEELVKVERIDPIPRAYQE